MSEIPEVVVLADQINESMAGKRIKGIKIPRSLGRFSFYLGDPNDYDTLMRDSYICGGRAIGGMVEIMADDKRIVFSDGAIPRLFDRNEEPNRKSRLTIEFSDGSFLCEAFSYTADCGVSAKEALTTSTIQLHRKNLLPCTVISMRATI